MNSVLVSLALACLHLASLSTTFSCDHLCSVNKGRSLGLLGSQTLNDPAKRNQRLMQSLGLSGKHKSLALIVGRIDEGEESPHGKGKQQRSQWRPVRLDICY